jgi:oligoendopeptidase F
MPKENKTTGAYSIGGTSGLSKYFILMNYDESIDSVYTLAHELGHSLNSYYYGIGQKIYQSTSIFCAEVASITNEVLLSHYLLNNADKEKDSKTKVFILDQLISGFFATTTRQIIFSNFEYDINELINKDEAITYDVISDKYLKLMDEYIGIKNLKKYSKPPYNYSLATILRISHFYAGNFYVYKYAIGQVVGTIIADKIIKKEPNALENYFKFLKSGTSLSPIETIKLLGIDLYEDKP